MRFSFFFYFFFLLFFILFFFFGGGGEGVVAIRFAKRIFIKNGIKF